MNAYTTAQTLRAMKTVRALRLFTAFFLTVGLAVGFCRTARAADGEDKSKDTAGVLTPAVSMRKIGDGKFYPLVVFNIRVDSARIVRGITLEMIVTYKNITRKKMVLAAGDFALTITDADGIGFRSIGNLYRASGDPDLEPERIMNTVWVEPGETARVRHVFTLPKGVTALKKLTISESLRKPQVYDVSAIKLAGETEDKTSREHDGE